MASFVYNRFKANNFNGEHDLGSGGDTLKVALMATGHSSSTATDNTWSDVSSNETSATGYTAGGATLANQAVTQGATTKLDADDVTWTITGSLSAYYAVIYDDTLTNDDLIASIDFGGEQTVTDADFTIAWHADGIITLA